MRIDKLKVSNFRNYKNLEIEFDKNINIFYGNNAQGKTNLIEAIYLLSVTKSFRNSSDKEIISLGEKESYIHGYFSDDNNIKFKIDLNLIKNKGKLASFNNLKLNRLNELIGKINIIAFSPEDLNIVKSSPSKRRSFMDIELCQINKVYMTNLSYYKKILEQRNKLLKQIYIEKKEELYNTLDIWDIQLVKYGKEIINERRKFIENISKIANKLNYEITKNNENLDIIYFPNINVDNFEREVKLYRNRDIATLVTNVGPHRDDIEFKINGIDVKNFGSQGQQRTVALILKLSEIKMVKEIFNKNAILLLDDVFSELDRERQNLLLEMVKDNQTFITCTGLEEFIENKIDNKKIYKVVNGSIQM